MKRGVLIVLMFLLATSSLLAQEKGFSLKTGAGVNVTLSYKGYGASSRHSIGPAMITEGTYQFNQWLSTGINIHTSLTKVGKNGLEYNLGGGLRGYVRPFGRKFKYLELGVGLTGVYRKEAGLLWNTSYGEWNYGYFGIEYPVRAYIIDNSKYQLMMFYDFKTIFEDRRYFWNYSVGGLMFGVRF